MKIVVIGIGQCGCNISDEFYAVNNYSKSIFGHRIEILTDAFAVNTDDTDLSSLKHIPRDMSHRIVIGAHGPYIEFSAEHFRKSIVITKGQEWRLNKKYNVKYLHMNIFGHEELKIYKQTKTVNYADYKPGFYYVDLYKVKLKDQ